MKNKFIITNLILMFIIALTNVSFGATGNVALSSIEDEVKIGDEFTVIISVSSERGINGIQTKILYDSNQVELKTAGVTDPAIWSNLGTLEDLAIICNSTETIKHADVYCIKFKVKDSAKVGDLITISTTEAILDTDSSTNSTETLPPQKVEYMVVSDIVENKDENKSNESEASNNKSNTDNIQTDLNKNKENKSNEKTSIKNENDKTNNNQNTQTVNSQRNNNPVPTNNGQVANSPTTPTTPTTPATVTSRSQSATETNRQDTTTAVSILPNTGGSYIIMIIIGLGLLILAFILYKKSDNIKIK